MSLIVWKGLFGDMKIDVVVSNPPYNKDKYLDFVKEGSNLADKCSLWITPAKWQAKGGEKNEAFRQNIVPHMSKIVYYPVSTDIFNIGESAGISYYITDKSVHTNKELKIVCVGQEQFSTDNKYISSDAKALVNSKIRAIIDKCSTMNNILGNKLNLHQSYYVKNTDSGHDKTSENDIEVWGGKAGGEKDITGKQFFLLGYKSKDELFRLDGVDKYKACLSCMPTGNNKYGAFDESGMAFGLKEILMLKPNQVPKGSYFPLMCFDTENEAKSFISYFNTRFIRFLIICSIVGTTISSELFRLVPDPGAFDHIFTDEELYKRYNLTEEEISIIESVIKERT
jgi:site-specific DNA-methyltransferase (adenine-specific)